MTLSVRLNELISAGFTGIWINSCEQQDALLELSSMCRTECWQLLSWNIEQGFIRLAKRQQPTNLLTRCLRSGR